MSDITAAIKRLEITHELICEKHGDVDITPYKCRSCDYYYINRYGTPRCIKENIRDWALYNIDRG